MKTLRIIWRDAATTMFIAGSFLGLLFIVAFLFRNFVMIQ